MNRLQIFRKLNGAIAICAAAFFFYAYYSQYYKWRDCFNELGRCFDSDTGIVFVEQAGMIWLTLGVLALGVSIWMLRPTGR